VRSLLHGRKKKAAAAAPKNKTTPPKTPPAIAPTFLGSDAVADDNDDDVADGVEPNVPEALAERLEADGGSEESAFGDVHPSIL